MIYPQLLAFFALVLFRYAWLHRVHNTVLILLAASAVNVVVNQFIGPKDPFILVFYSQIDVITMLAIFKYGDIMRWYQIVLLMAALVAHIVCQVDVQYGLNAVWGSYEFILGTLTVFQLLGGVTHGVAERKRPFDNDDSESGIHYFRRIHKGSIQ
jgi:hypothetical protein